MESVASTRRLRLLSLDGGGVRGLSSLLILKRIMYVLDQKVDRAVKRPLLPCDYFDMVAGTSTGGLIALMIGVLQLDIDTCISQYLAMAPQIFPKEGFIPGSKIGKILKGVGGKARFDAGKLEKIIKELVTSTLKTLDEDAVLEKMSNVEGDTCCRTFVCVVNKDVNKPCILRSYQSSWEPGTGCTIWQAARATSAAPLYFPPIRFGIPPANYVDGGLRYNNPVRALYDEAKRVWGKSKREVGCIISIGTGIKQLRDVGDKGTAILQSLAEIAFDAQQVAQEFADEIEHRIEDNVESLTYIRLDVDQGLQNMKMEEWKDFDMLTGATNDYLKSHKGDIERCANALLDLDVGSNNREKTCTVLSELPISNQAFFGRISELEQMHKTFSPPNLEQKIVVLWGLGGSGKSRLALQYLKLSQSTYSAILWINAASDESANESLAQFVAEIEASERTRQSPLSPRAREIDRNFVKRWLTSASNSSWLIVIDSFDDLENFDCKQLIPQCKYGHIIITTTQFQLAKSLDIQGIEVGSIGLEAGSEMLLSNVNSTDIENAKRIVRELNGIPLAIEQARALLQQCIAVHEFLDFYDKEYTRVMAKKPEKSLWFYDKNISILNVLSLMYNRLSQCNQDATKLLALVSCFGSRLVPFKVLNQVQDSHEVAAELADSPKFFDRLQWLIGLRGGQLPLRLATNQLENFSLLKVRKDLDGSLLQFSVHSTICRWRLETFDSSEREEWVILAAYLLSRELIQPGRDDFPQLEYFDLIKHCCQLIQRYVTPEAIDPPEGRLYRPYGLVMSRLGPLYLRNGHVREAKTMLEAAVKASMAIQGSVWPNDQSSLFLLKHLAMALWKSDSLELAAETLDSLYESSVDICGDMNGLTIWAQSRIRDIRDREAKNVQNERRAVVASAGPKRNLRTLPNLDLPEHFQYSTPKSFADQFVAEKLKSLAWSGGVDGEGSAEQDIMIEAESIWVHACESYEKDWFRMSAALKWLVYCHLTSGQPTVRSLGQASWNDRSDFTRCLIAHNVDVNSRQVPLNLTPLHEAVITRDQLTLELLLDHGASPSAADHRGYTPLHTALIPGNYSISIISMLVAKGANLESRSNEGDTPLFLATKNSEVEVMKILSDGGADLDIFGSDRRTLIHEAAYRGNAEVLKFFVGKEIDINAQDSKGCTPLHYSVIYNHQDSMKELLRCNPETDLRNSEGFTPLHYAIEQHSLETVKELLRHGANPNLQNPEGFIPLHCAIEQDSLETVKELLQHGANPNLQNPEGFIPLYCAVRQNSFKIVTELLNFRANPDVQNPEGFTPLHCAVRQNLFKIVKVLLNFRANPDVQDWIGWTPLLYAVRLGKKQATRQLLQHGAEINIQDKSGWTPLHHIARLGDEEVVKQLLEHGADITVKNEHGETPLHFAAELCYQEVVKQLVENGADITSRDEFGRTPLHFAVKFDYEEVLKQLLENGADITSRDDFGQTPLHCAAKYGHEEVVKHLLKKGAKIGIKDKSGVTPLQIAKSYEHNAVAEILSENGRA